MKGERPESYCPAVTGVSRCPGGVRLKIAADGNCYGTSWFLAALIRMTGFISALDVAENRGAFGYLHEEYQVEYVSARAICYIFSWQRS